MKKLTAQKLIIFLLFLLAFFCFLPTLNKALATSLIINPPFGNVSEGKDLTVDVVLKGEDETVDGADILINFDSKILKVKEIKNGPFFGDYPVKKGDGNQVRITALAPKDGVKVFGEVVVASIIFEVLDSGQTKLDIVFQNGSTTDSNVPSHGKIEDSLKDVKGGSYSVVASPEKLRQAKANQRKAPSALPIFLLILVLIGVGVWYWWKHRKPPKEDVFIPEPFPLDRPPKVE